MAAVTAVLNLDTSVAFLTQVLILAARAEGFDEEPFLFGTLFMSGAASLLLPGSNLTSPWSSPATTSHVQCSSPHAAGMDRVGRSHRRVHCRRVPPPADRPSHRHQPATAQAKLGWSAAAIAVAAVLVLVLPSPALPVAGLGAALAALAIRRGTLSTREIWEAVDPATLAAVFGVAVAIGTLARVWSGPAHLMANANRGEQRSSPRSRRSS